MAKPYFVKTIIGTMFQSHKKSWLSHLHGQPCISYNTFDLITDRKQSTVSNLLFLFSLIHVLYSAYFARAKKENVFFLNIFSLKLFSYSNKAVF